MGHENEQGAVAGRLLFFWTILVLASGREYRPRGRRRWSGGSVRPQGEWAIVRSRR